MKLSYSGIVISKCTCFPDPRLLLYYSNQIKTDQQMIATKVVRMQFFNVELTSQQCESDFSQFVSDLACNACQRD